MRNKIATVLLLFITVFLLSEKTPGSVATFYMGGSIGGNETIDDYYYDDRLYSADYSNIEIGFSYIHGYRICFDYSGIITWDGFRTQTAEIWELKFGYPFINGKNGIFYVTAGYNQYVREEGLKCAGVMLGGDLIWAVSDGFLVEGDFQYSYLGASYWDYQKRIDFPAEQLSLKLKTQIALSNKVSLLIAYRIFDYNVDKGLIVANISNPSFGLIYRL